MEGPILVAFLDAEDSWVKFVVEVKSGAEFCLGGGVEGVDVVGD
jgi:hypothetical protein